MTETEWLTCEDPKEMLVGLEGLVTERQLRLFACAYCRSVWKHITDRHTKALIRLTEGTAETADSEKELQAIWGVHFAKSFVCGGRRLDKARIYSWVLDQVEPVAPNRTEKAVSLLREILGNPFHSVVFSPVWRSSDVMLLARGIYDDRVFDRMPILADALQDAGCDNADILTHLRDPNATHVRGCWALDLVLGKE